MIEYQNTYFTYNEKPLISGFSLSIHKNEKVTFYGPSGSGKSTLIHALLGFVHPDSGNITINNTPLQPSTINHIRTLTAWLPQDISLPATTVRQLIHTPFQFQNNRHLQPTDDEILHTFDQLALEHHLLDKPANEISGGQRQRIMLATATMLHKPILLLDEPTSALDPQTVEQTIRYLRTLPDTTMIAISHDQHFIDSFDRKILING